MSRNIKVLCLMAATLMLPVAAHASGDRDDDRDRPQTYVKDSTITSEIKSRLSEEHGKSMARIHVETEDHGVVKLSGHVRSQDDMERAVSIARDIQGVREVRNHLQIHRDD